MKDIGNNCEDTFGIPNSQAHCPKEIVIADLQSHSKILLNWFRYLNNTVNFLVKFEYLAFGQD